MYETRVSVGDRLPWSFFDHLGLRTVSSPCARALEGGNHKSSDWFIRSRDGRRCRTNNVVQLFLPVTTTMSTLMSCPCWSAYPTPTQGATRDIRHMATLSRVPCPHDRRRYGPQEPRILRHYEIALYDGESAKSSPHIFHQNSWPPHSTRRVFRRLQETPPQS